MAKQTVILAVSVKPEQKAAVAQFAKDNGCLSVSEGMRAILDEFFKRQARENGLSQLDGLKLSEV